jgi:hypothetical protein
MRKHWQSLILRGWGTDELMREDCEQPAPACVRRLLEGCQRTIFKSYTLRTSLPLQRRPDPCFPITRRGRRDRG